VSSNQENSFDKFTDSPLVKRVMQIKDLNAKRAKGRKVFFKESEYCG
jgi:hypothetical protein